MIRRTVLLGMVLALVAATSEGQNRSRFDVATGPQFGLQDSETPMSRGWIVSTGFDIDGQDFLVEGSWHLASSAHERYFGGDDPFDSIGLELRGVRVMTLAAGVRSPKSERLVAPFYQVLAGGFQWVSRTDYQYGAPCCSWGMRPPRLLGSSPRSLPFSCPCASPSLACCGWLWLLWVVFVWLPRLFIGA